VLKSHTHRKSEAQEQHSSEITNQRLDFPERLGRIDLTGSCGVRGVDVASRVLPPKCAGVFAAGEHNVGPAL